MMFSGRMLLWTDLAACTDIMALPRMRAHWTFEVTDGSGRSYAERSVIGRSTLGGRERIYRYLDCDSWIRPIQRSRPTEKGSVIDNKRAMSRTVLGIVARRALSG